MTIRERLGFAEEKLKLSCREYETPNVGYWRGYRDAIEDVKKDQRESPRPDWTPCAEGYPTLTEDGCYPQVRVTYRTWMGNLEVTDAVYMEEYNEWFEVRHDGQYDLENVIAWKPQDATYRADQKEDAE